MRSIRNILEHLLFVAIEEPATPLGGHHLTIGGDVVKGLRRHVVERDLSKASSLGVKGVHCNDRSLVVTSPCDVT